MQIVSVINYKGGVGKTTVTANLAAFLACQGKKVLLLDMDSQASLTFSFVEVEYWKQNLQNEKTIKQWFDCIIEGKEIPVFDSSDMIVEPARVKPYFTQASGKVGLIASHLDLINIDLELAALLRGTSLTQAKKQHVKVHGHLRKALKSIPDVQYDIVLIDCPPNFNIVTKNALIASDYIIVPAKPDYLSTLGIDYLQRSVTQLTEEYNEYVDGLPGEDKIHPNYLGVIFTMVAEYGSRPQQILRQYINETKRSVDIPVFEKYLLHYNSFYAVAPEQSIPVFLQGNDRVVSNLKEIGVEFLDRIKWS
jgi:chromosome partitioning protein